MKIQFSISSFDYAVACVGARMAGAQPELTEAVSRPFLQRMKGEQPPPVPPAPRVPVVVEDEPNLSC